MNQSNFEYLRDQVKFTGFGEGMEPALKEKLEQQLPDFQLTHQTKFNEKPIVAVLHFRKSDQSDMYFFNRYQVSLQSEKDQKSLEQTFYINKGNHNVTLKEAFNLMEGRSVNKDLTNKEGEIYNAWLRLDFKEADKNGNYKLHPYTEKYGYNLEDVLSRHPIKELANETDKAALIDSLHKGNRQAVMFQTEGKEERYFIEANPQFKTVNVYDSSMKRQNTREAKTEGQSEQKGQEQKTKQTKGAADDTDSPATATKNNKRKGHSIS